MATTTAKAEHRKCKLKKLGHRKLQWKKFSTSSRKAKPLGGGFGTQKALERWVNETFKWWFASLFTRELKNSHGLAIFVWQPQLRKQNIENASWKSLTTGNCNAKILHFFHSSATWRIPLKSSHSTLQQRSDPCSQQFDSSFCRFAKVVHK